MKFSKNSEIPLGRQVAYTFHYDPGQLCPIPRQAGREAAGIADAVARHGEDIWNIYELSWLSMSGKPEVAMAELRVPADSPFLIESKSLKLYCNSFNMTRFTDRREVEETMVRDLSAAAGTGVAVSLVPAGRFGGSVLAEPEGVCLDDQDPGGFSYILDPSRLVSTPVTVQETLFSRLFRSCCPVTGQPDWATVAVSYRGPRIDRAGLLQYLVSYREHTGFHEACVEKIFSDIMARCRPAELMVWARFTRRGGLDINPVRSTRLGPWPNIRDPRQ